MHEACRRGELPRGERYACAIANHGLRPRPANVRDDMSPNRPGTNCRLPTKPDGFRRVLPSHGHLGLLRHVAGSLAASGMKGL